jgi:hypothetical protein
MQSKHKFLFLFFLALLCSSLSLYSQTITITSPNTSSSYCNYTSVSVTFTISGSFTNTPTTNIFSIELSDGTGSFASPTVIGTRTATSAGTINCTLPLNILTGTLYTIRVVSSNPIATSPAILLGSITAPSIAAPVIANTAFCQGETVSVPYTKVCTFPSGNIFSAQLSDATGSFSSPITIGTITSTNNGTISAIIPAGTPAGTGYRIRVVGSNPVTTSSDNGTNLTVNAAAGTPVIYGNGEWIAYEYNGNAFANYYGYYTESSLSFDTQNRWNTTTGPGTVNTSTGVAYSGCPIGGTYYSVSFKRTNIPCGFYQLDINYQDDGASLWIDGVKKWENTAYTSTAQLNVWRGFISPSMNVEFQLKNNAGPGRLQITLTPNSGITLSAPTTICATTSTTITATNTTGLSLNYSWDPATTVDNPTASTVIATPLTTTTYTVSGIDVTTGCSTTSSVITTVNPLPSTTMTATVGTICSGVTTATLTATGANVYSWSPATGLSATTGNTVVATPTSTTTYTVSGSNNCAVNTVSTVITVQTPPATPLATTFGSGTWNAYCYNSTNFTNYYGYYTENSLNFNTTTRWNANNGPTIANAATGSAYSGCTFGGTNYSISFKRTNFTCGYYQIDIPYHDDDYYLLINGVQVAQHVGCCDIHTAAWTGFLGPATTVEFRLINNNGPGSLQISINSVAYNVLSPPVTICAGTSSTLSANTIAGASYSWAPSTDLSSASGQTTVATPATTTNYSCTISDPGTGCSGTASILVTVNPLPSTTVTPTTATLNCSSSIATLVASGANTYTWSPSAGLSSTTGFTVTASPTTTTTYTVSGSNNCATNGATTVITVTPLATPSTFPSGYWNAYCYNGINTTALANYYGYYTENNLSFDTRTRWASGASPSTANTTSGLAYKGCTMPATNLTMSFKRTGFTCGIYTINILFHDDNLTLYINGVQVAQHNTCCDTHSAIWTGTLCSTSTVEFVLSQGTGGSGLSATLVPVAQPASQLTWTGAADVNWYNPSNWCGTINVTPTLTTDVLIPSAGPAYMPSISTTGAECRNITINGAVATGTYNSLIAAASLTIPGTNTLSVYGNWTNLGTLNAYQSTVTFTGSATNLVNCASTESFYNVDINNTNNVNVASGMHTIVNNLHFTAGKMLQNGTFEIANGATVSNVSSSNYIEGPVRKTGNTAFTFPVGKNGKYRPISMSAPSLTTDHFTAQYFNTNPLIPYSDVLKDASINHLGKMEYWILDRTGGTSGVYVTLSWDNTSGSISNINTLVVARYDAATSTWKNHGNGLVTGNAIAGTIKTSAPVTSFSPFDLASTTSENALPIELLSFSANQTKNNITLTWATASELNNKEFIIEKSVDGNTFAAIGTVDGAGTSTEEHHYTLIDEYPVIGNNYYRILQIDIDGTSSYSNIATCNFVGKAENATLKIFPNPTDGSITVIAFSVYDAKSEKQITIENTLGEIIYRKTIDGSIDKISFDALSKAPKGMYIVRLTMPSGMLSEKVIVK